MKVVIASTNPVKINSVKNGFSRCFPGEEIEIVSVSIPSGVSDQPMTEKETMQGAENRVNGARKQIPTADFWVGVEGGMEMVNSQMLDFSWVVVIGKGKKGYGRSASFFLPEKIAMLIREGKELGEAIDIVFNKTNAKQANGAIGLLTRDIITRSTLVEPAVITALIPFMNPDLY